MVTLKSRDGKLIFHGNIIQWITDCEFLFVPQRGSIMNPMWCKTDFWQVIE